MSHSLSISKAALAASFMKPDPVPLSRGEIATFHATLDGTLRHCSPDNIEQCKKWLAANVLHSTGRVAALLKFLSAISDDIASSADSHRDGGAWIEPIGPRKQLHIFYLLHDVLHHIKFHAPNRHVHEIFEANMKLCLRKLAASYLQSNGQPECDARVHKLLDIWSSQAYLDDAFVEELRSIAQEEVVNGESNWHTAAEAVAEEKKTAPYVMPSSHGDPMIPFYDLPAANLLPHIVPNSTRPMDPHLIKPLQFSGVLAERSLSAALETFLNDIDGIDSKLRHESGGRRTQIDALGQQLPFADRNNDPGKNDNYYGWSHEFCNRVKLGDVLEGLDPIVGAPNAQSLGVSHLDPDQSSASAESIPDADEDGVPPHKSLSRSYSPPPPSYHYRSPAPQGRSPPTDPRRTRVSNSVDSRNARLGLDTADNNDDRGRASTQMRGGIPPRPAHYQGPWPPPPPPTTSPDMQGPAANNIG